MDAQEYDALVALKARIEALAEEARAIQKEVSPAFKSVERRYYRMDDGSRKYIEFLRLTSIGCKRQSGQRAQLRLRRRRCSR